MWWLDFCLVCAVLLLAESARGVVIGTLYPYLTSLGGDSLFLGLTVSAFSVGRLIASFAFGALADFWSTRAVLLLSTVGCMTGNFLFCCAGSLSSKYVLLFSRVLTGFGTGMLSVARTHVSVTTPSDERTLWMSWLGIVQFVGFAVTPVVGNLQVRQVDFGFMLINSYTFATLLLLLLECLVFVLLLFFMSNQSAGEQSQREVVAQKVEASATQPVDVNGNEVDSESAYHQLDDDKVDLDQQRSMDDIGEEDEKAVYLDEELHHSQPSASTSTRSAAPRWAPHDASLTMPVHDLSLYSQQTMEPRRGTTGLEALQQRDVIVYMEQRTPTGHATIYTPHHFVFTGDPNDTENPGQLIATSAPTASLPALVPASQPPSSPRTLQRRMSTLYAFLLASYVPLVFVFLNLSGRGILSVAEAFGTKMYDRITGPDGPSPDPPVTASTFFLIMGCMGLVVFLFMNRLVKWVEEANLLMLSFISMGIGFGVLVDFDDISQHISTHRPHPRSSHTTAAEAMVEKCALWLTDADNPLCYCLLCVSADLPDFIAGMTLVWVIGTPISQTLSVSMLSRHFSQQQKAGLAPTRGVGFWMGLVTASGSVGRIIFPLIAGALSLPTAALFASLAAFLTLPLIFFPLKAYKPYLPWIRDRLACLFPADDALGPHRVLRTSSNGDRTEMLMLADDSTAPVASPSSVAADDLLATGGSVSSVGSADSNLLLSTQPMLFFVPSSASAGGGGEMHGGKAMEGTPLVGADGKRSSHPSAYYSMHSTGTPISTPKQISTPRQSTPKQVAREASSAKQQ